MGLFDLHLELLTDEKLDALRARNMGDLNLDQVVDTLKVLRTDLELGNDLRPEEVSVAVRSNIEGPNFRGQIQELLTAMSAYGMNSQNPTQERAQLLTRAEGLRDVVMTHLRPILRPPIERSTKLLSALESMRVTLAATQVDLQSRIEELAKQQEAVATDSGNRATGDLANHYRNQANSHKDSAALLLNVAIGSGVALGALVIVTFAWLAPSTEDWTEFVRESMLRLLLLSVSTVALVFCLRNYRVNKHLEVLNKRRENALNTFGPLQGAVTSEDARNFVVQELVRAVFAHEDTGYVQADSERTVIESSTGMLSALAAARGREAT